VPREVPSTLQTSAEVHPNDEIPVHAPHRGNDAHHAVHEPDDAPQERPMGSYFRQQPAVAEPPAEVTEPVPPAEPKPAAARGRGRSRKAVPPPVEMATPPTARQEQTEPQPSSSAAGSLPVAPAETEPDQPKKAPARPRRSRKPAADTGAQ
jgi:hypothetical protein